MSTRLDALRQMLASDPNSTFARYALAMELMSLGRAEDAVTEFRTVLEIDPNYAAAYFHAGRALEALGRTQEARQLYQAGIEATARTGDTHTRLELQAALDSLV